MTCKKCKGSGLEFHGLLAQGIDYHPYIMLCPPCRGTGKIDSKSEEIKLDSFTKRILDNLGRIEEV